MQEEKIQQFEGLIKQEQIFFKNQFSYSFYLITRNQISLSRRNPLQSRILSQQQLPIQKKQCILDGQIKKEKIKKNGFWSANQKNQNCNGCGGDTYLMIKRLEVDNNKNGKWIELSEGFTFTGQWNTVAWGQEFVGGSNDEDGLEIKIGWWTKLNNRFSEYSLFFFIGEYKNGQKVVKWTHLWNIYWDNKEVQNVITVIIQRWRLILLKDNGKKIGKQIGLSDQFSYLSQVTCLLCIINIKCCII
ncbi:unnamed protein product [Paramecium primaurelia]|uniref:Uncharacterized protein n=1 Tax=Paramecium primaurelia TaxID=5886 RepID=A0A8S1QR81_PARPR|nr:unnamed protein product [Paramecium primaurelia]